MSSAARQSLLPLAALIAFLVTTALSLGKPGLPASLRGDEAAHFLQTTSLASDGDLRIEAADLERLFFSFPYDAGPSGTGIRVPLRLDGDGRATVDRPLPYALLAAPWQAVFGVNGPLALNMALALLAIASLAHAFRRIDATGGAAFSTAVFAVGLSAIFPYLFQYHPAALWAALGSLVLAGGGLPATPGAAPRDEAGGIAGGGRIGAAEGGQIGAAEGGRILTALTIGGGAAWALLTWTFPSALAVLPALLLRVRHCWRRWLLGAAGGAVLGLLFAYLGAQPPFNGDDARFEIAVQQPAELATAADFESLRAPAPTVLAEEAHDGLPGLLRDTFIERRRGLLPYFPLVLLALGAAALGWRRLEGWRWLLLAGLGLHVLYRGAQDDPLLGGTQLGDPGQAALYPLFFLLVPAMPALSVRLAGFALAILALGPALAASLGPAAAFGGPQAHTRGLLSSLPLAAENVGRAGVYRPMTVGGPSQLDARLWWPSYGGEQHLDELWLLGGERLTLYFETAEPLDEPSLWRLRNLAPGNVARLRFAGHSRRIAFPDELPPGGQGADIEWPATESRKIEAPGGEKRHLYSLRLDTRRGFKPSWQGRDPRSFYLGAALTLLGPRSHLERDVFAATALGCGAPPSLEASEPVQALVRLKNDSAETWNAKGAVRVRLAHRWLHGGTVVEGPRTDLGRPVAPGETWKSWMAATAPAEAGRYQLAVDLVYENVAFFADRRGEPLCEIGVEVTEAGPSTGS